MWWMGSGRRNDQFRNIGEGFVAEASALPSFVFQYRNLCRTAPTTCSTQATLSMIDAIAKIDDEIQRERQNSPGQAREGKEEKKKRKKKEERVCV